jgi:acyl-CoA synthetase (AMP-forming)/AMP-acid ligase II/thioesterase domain-containing protein/acyl carrier protein
MTTSVHGLIRAQAEITPQAAAILASGRAGLTYARLLAHIEEVVVTLNEAGIGRGDRVGVVLPNGPEMATAFMAVASAATCAPLNPAYRTPEFEFYLSDLNARALVLPAGSDSPAREVAVSRNIPIIELTFNLAAEPGIFTLHTSSRGHCASAGRAQPEDVALVLHTSGTTSRPKIVPLTHANLCASARSIGISLRLEAADRCLNVMPLFHIHGLIAAVLSSLAAGASVVCTPGFDGSRIYEWLETFRPTWFTAVPTMHQAILAHPGPEDGPLQKTSLRFIRSCSSALPPTVMAQLEGRFGVPVVEAYGMTEASHQMACNPLPPGERRPGSVGIAAGPEIAIMDEAGNLLPPGERGEIVIRGPNVTGGYENNPAANEKAFTNGWFRTGDEGCLSADGYLRLTDRMKEIINRGGEKVSPREIDETLLQHPAVAQAATFAIPHPELGEDIAAVVVLRKGETSSNQELREFLSKRLAAHKVPRQVLILPEIPKGPTGKLQRIGLGEKLKQLLHAEFVAPGTPTEKALAGIWAQVLNAQRVGVNDNFFMDGGSSLSATEMLGRVEETFGVRVRLDDFFKHSVLSHLAAEIDRRKAEGPGKSTAAGPDEPEPVVVPIQPEGDRVPFFMVDLGLGWEVRDAAKYLGADQPVYGLRPSHLIGDGAVGHDTRSIASHFVEALREVRPHGPYMLGGGCAGGIVAFEMAQQLAAKGESVPMLALFDVDFPPPAIFPGLTGVWLLRVPREFGRLRHMSAQQRREYILSRMRIWTGRIFGRSKPEDREDAAGTPQDIVVKHELLYAPLRDCVWRYSPQRYPGRIELFLASETGVWPFHDRRLAWRRVAPEACGVHMIAGQHHLALKEPHARENAATLRACMDAALARQTERNEKKEGTADKRRSTRIRRRKRRNNTGD